ncbi:SGNH/GDSL hydrolase family protein [Pedobacter immunditicola]|uniref:SGNH/GDSL hydrolase family protein n=1 Tax=Pedobacter immunditicola TaxID=3133440 RepID=UPI003098F71F
MKSLYFNKIYAHKIMLAIGVFSLAACKPSIDTVAPDKGTADFSRYIAVGDSYTAGFADGGLYLEGQKNSFPEMLAAQLRNVGGGEFATPFFTEAQANGSGYLKLTGFNPNGTPIITPETTNLAIRGQVAIPGFGDVTLYTKHTGAINNYGVPGLKSTHVNFAPYGNLNGYYERLLPGNAGANNTAYLDFITAEPFTFFSLWLGYNDIAGYANSGGAGDVPTPAPTFSALYHATVNKLVESGARGVLATIPDLVNLPYFKTVTLESLLAAIRATPAGASVTALYIKTGANVTRAATVEDLFTLTLSSANVIGVPNQSQIPYGLHPLNPIESKWVLDPAEVAVVNNFVNDYNATIKSAAASKGLALMDAYELLNTYTTKNEQGELVGAPVNGAEVSSAFITGNLYSLDGIHLTPLGYAIMANGFIKAINSQYGSSIPIVAVSKFSGVKFP